MCKKYPAFYSWVQCAHSWSNTMWQKTYLINYSRGLRWKVKFSITHLFPKSSTTFFLSNRFYVCNWGSKLMEFQGFCQMNWFIDSFQNLSIYSPKKEFHGFNCTFHLIFPFLKKNMRVEIGKGKKKQIKTEMNIIKRPTSVKVNLFCTAQRCVLPVSFPVDLLLWQ